MHYMFYFIVPNVYCIRCNLYLMKQYTMKCIYIYIVFLMLLHALHMYTYVLYIYMSECYICAFTYIIYSFIWLPHIYMYYSMTIFDEQSNIFLYEVYHRWIQLTTDTICCEPVHYIVDI